MTGNVFFNFCTGITVKYLSKCKFCVNSVYFFGYNVSSKGLLPPSRKLAELREIPYPTDSKSLRRFLGMFGFYRKLILNFASVVYPLTECVRVKPNLKSLELTKNEKDAFDSIKSLLCNISALAHPRSDVRQYQLVTDSSYAVGAALPQMVNSQPIPIGFFSKKLSQAQCKYSAFDRELLAAYLAVLYFKHQIEGNEVLLLTDHKPLFHAFHSLKPAKSDRQQRHLSILRIYIRCFVHKGHAILGVFRRARLDLWERPCVKAPLAGYTAFLTGTFTERLVAL